MCVYVRLGMVQYVLIWYGCVWMCIVVCFGCGVCKVFLLFISCKLCVYGFLCLVCLCVDVYGLVWQCVDVYGSVSIV